MTSINEKSEEVRELREQVNSYYSDNQELTKKLAKATEGDTSNVPDATGKSDVISQELADFIYEQYISSYPKANKEKARLFCSETAWKIHLKKL